MKYKEAPRKKKNYLFLRKDMSLGLSKLSKEKDEKFSFIKCESVGIHIEYKHLAEKY